MDNLSTASKQDIILSELCSFRYAVLNELQRLKEMLKEQCQNSKYLCKCCIDNKVMQVHSAKDNAYNDTSANERAVHPTSAKDFPDNWDRNLASSSPDFKKHDTCNEESEDSMIEEKIDSPMISLENVQYDVDEHDESVYSQDFPHIFLSGKEAGHVNIQADDLVSKLNNFTNASSALPDHQLDNLDLFKNSYDTPETSSSFGNSAWNTSNRTLVSRDEYDAVIPFRITKYGSMSSKEKTLKKNNSKQLEIQQDSSDTMKQRNKSKLVPKVKPRKKKVNPYQCNKCKLLFASRRAFNLHMVSHYSGASTKFKSEQLDHNRCFLCQKTFSCKTSLRRHVALHMKLFKCSICDKPFSSKWALKMHAQVHTGVRPFQCTICFKTYSSKWYLVQHSRKCDSNQKFHD